MPGSIPAVNGTPRVAYSLRVLDLIEGSGAAAVPRKCYYVHYTGWLAADGRKFDSSHDTTRNGQQRDPLNFPQGARAVVLGWDVGGFDGMRIGGHRRLFIPYQLAYGERGFTTLIPPRANLIFDVELVAMADTLARTDTVPPRRRVDFLPRCPGWNEVRAAASC
jgi:peptidylprolyl isomerase